MFGTVAILGTGLMGGSMAAALGARLPAVRRVGFGLEPDLSQALARGLFDEGASTVAGAVHEADLVVLAAPISVNCALMGEVVRHMRPDALLTDLSSVKGPVVDALRAAVAGMAGEGGATDGGPADGRAGACGEGACGAARAVADAGGRGAHTGAGMPVGADVQAGAEVSARAGVLARFVASHPIAGSEKSGPMAADPDLFVGRESVLSMLPGTAPQTVARLEALWQQLGAHVTRMTVAEHDRVFALVSHVPHAVAFAMAGVVALDGRDGVGLSGLPPALPGHAGPAGRGGRNSGLPSALPGQGVPPGAVAKGQGRDVARAGSGVAGTVAVEASTVHETSAVREASMIREDRVRAGDHAGPGLLDMTRIAASSPALWADILLQNRAQTLDGLDVLSARLQMLAQALQAGDRERLTALLAQGADWRREQH